MKDYTVFWSHPTEGEGTFLVGSHDIETAGHYGTTEITHELAADRLQSEDDPGYDEYHDVDVEFEAQIILDEMNLVVYQGKHTNRPDRTPDWVLA